MYFRRLLLLWSAVISIAYSFPTRPDGDSTTSILHKNGTNFSENIKPLVFIMEEKDPKSDSVVVQFVYSSNGGNSILETKSLDKEKYTINHSTLKETEEKSMTRRKEKANTEKEKSNNNEKEKEKTVKVLKINKTENSQRNAQHSTENIHLMEVTSLTPEEMSPLSGKWPKHLFDAFNPIQPFPELQFGKTNKIHVDKLHSGNVDLYVPNIAKEKKDLLNVAGPHLSPLSVYEREFTVPIFD